MNIKTMIDRNLAMLKGEKIVDVGFGFPWEAYTGNVIRADGDLLTRNAVYDLKTSVNPPKKEDTLQVFCYFLMGYLFYDDRFESVDKVGITNPRLNTKWILDLEKVPDETVREIIETVFGF